jgi:predicted amidohydrolase YtcJ
MCQSCVDSLFGPIDLLRTNASRPEFLASFAAAAGAVAMAVGMTRPASAATSGADTIFHGGPIYPMTSQPVTVEAIAERNGKIVAAGSYAEISGLKTGATRLVNLDGRVLFPGFIDAHQHTMLGSLLSALFVDVGFTKYKTKAEVVAALKADVAKKKPGEWVYATNYDNLLQGGDWSMTELDAVSTANPVMVYYINAHNAGANALAFKAAKIPDDVGVLPGGGSFGRDASGKLNGLINEEPALKKFLVGFPPITPAFAGKAVMSWLAINAKAGNTLVHEPGVLVVGNILEGYEAIGKAATPARTSIALMIDSLEKGERYRSLGIGARATQLPESNLSLSGIKIVGDGSNQTKTASQTVPYLGGSDKGHPNYDAATLKSLTAGVKAAGWPIQIHANGDATLDIALDAMEAVYGANPKTGINRIEHCTITRPEQLVRMKKLGVQPSFLMNHVYFYGAAYRDQIFGPDRANRMDPAAECVALGLPFTLHTDAPCSNIGTLQIVQTAVTRKCATDGSVVGVDQAISVHHALRAVTAYAAAQVGMADRLGTLETGKEADLTILEGDPYAVDPEKIMDIKVAETWIKGKKVVV